MRLRFGESPQMVSQRFVIARRFLTHEDEIHFQTTQMPEGMRDQYFAHDFDVPQMTNHDDDNRQVAGNALSPERPLTFGSAAKTRRRRPQLGSRKNNETSQLLKGLDIGAPNAKPAHLQLGTGPCGLKSAGTSVKFRIAHRKFDNRFTGLCHDGNERELKSLVRQNRDATAQAENWIEHGTHTVR